MFIMHVALGGCLASPPVSYGLTEDTGGHIAYVLAAVAAQARNPLTERVEIVTRGFVASDLGLDLSAPHQVIGPKQTITRLQTSNAGYLAKEALAREIPELVAAFLDMLAHRERKPDVIHAHFADAARLAFAAADRFGCRVIYTPHSLAADKQATTDRDTPALSRRIGSERAALARSDAIIVSSRDEAERQVMAYDVDVSGHVHTVQPGVTLDQRPPEPTLARALISPYLADPDKPFILAVARPVQRKNLARLVQAYAETPDLRDAANLVMLTGQRGCGEASESRKVTDELSRLVDAHGLNGLCAMPATHTRADVHALFHLAATQRGVFANVALHEPFGLTLLEAAQTGLPVVCTRSGGAADIVGAIGHGRLVDPRDTEDIAAALIGLLNDRTEWSAASRNAFVGVRQFDWDRWATRSLRICRDLKQDHAKPAGNRMLVSDIDGTLTGCKASAARFGAEIGRRNYVFTLSTGRCLSEARGVLADWNLPEPDIFMTACGTEIHHRDRRGRWTLCDTYAALLSTDWDRAAVLRVIGDLHLETQAEIEQRRWKLGCIGSPVVARRLSRRLRTERIEARIVHSHGRLIDVLAPRGGKASAMLFTARQMGLTAADCVAAGDSGNDRDMLLTAGRGIVVANALAELRLAHDAVYLAEKCHSDGVLEGMSKVGLIAPLVGVSRSAATTR